MPSKRNNWLSPALIVASSILTILIYWSGLSGPLLFDDYWNLAPVERWAAGTQTFLTTLLPNQDSIVFSRPVAMGSFMLTTWLGGVGTFPLKLGNLCVHLLCGFGAFWLLRQALSLDPKLASKATPLAAILLTFWLIHPLHVSTVLYSVQRMAQLSTLFTLLAVALYLYGRRQLSLEKMKRAYACLFMAVPLTVLAGILSKQNAVVAPFLCLALEIAYYGNAARTNWPLKTFFLIFTAMPLCGAIAVLSLWPDRVFGGYADLEFSMWERLLSQPRALMDYIGMWFIPRSARMGLYTDDFPISTGFFHPITTIPAALALLGITAIAFKWRTKSPSFLAGWLFFIVSHGVESSFLPLELYYEHRNYLPSVGLLLAAAGLLSMATEHVKTRFFSRKQLAVGIFASLALILAFSTYARVLVWQSEDAMTLQGMRHHPNSIRVHLDRMSLALRHKDMRGAEDALRAMQRSNDSRQKLIARMDEVSVRCIRGLDVQEQDLIKATKGAMPMLTVGEVHVALLQEAITRNGACTTIPPTAFADSLVRLLDAANKQPESASNKSTIRRLAGQLYARGEDWKRAEEQAEIGWEGLQTLPLGVLLTRAYVKNGRIERAAEILAILETKVRPFDNLWQGELSQLRSMVHSANRQLPDQDGSSAPEDS